MHHFVFVWAKSHQPFPFPVDLDCCNLGRPFLSTILPNLKGNCEIVECLRKNISKGNRIRFTYKPYQIKTVDVLFEKGSEPDFASTQWLLGYKPFFFFSPQIHTIDLIIEFKFPNDKGEIWTSVTGSIVLSSDYFPATWVSWNCTWYFLSLAEL